MDPYKETFNTWNNIASLYQEKFMHLDLYNKTYDHFCGAISRRNAKILELGCGPGNISKYLLTKRPDLDLFGIDISPNMIKLAKENNPAGNFVVMDTRDIKDLNTKYDAVIAGFCLPYLSPGEAMQLISDVNSLLNVNGVFYLSFVEGDAIESGYKVGSGGRVYFYFHKTDDLKTKLAASRFVEIKTFELLYNRSEKIVEKHMVIIAEKSSA